MPISKNRYLDALLKFILLTAVIHVFLLFIASIINADIIHLNYFNILDVDLFFPGVEIGLLSQILSVVAIIIIYVTIYIYFTKNEVGAK